MRRQKSILLLLAALLCLWQPALAQERGLQATLKQMADLLAAQQKQLDEQARELAEQRELIRELQGDKPSAKTEPVVAQQPDPTPSPPPTADTADPGDAPSAQDQAKKALVEKQTAAPESSQEQVADLQKAIDDPSNTIYDADFIGAWYLPGTTAAMKVGGYVNLSLVNSFDPMTIPDRFIVGSIPPDGQTVLGAIEGTSVSADQTRVNLEYREQTSQGEVRAFVEGDFRGDGDTFRLRHAFGQFHAFLAGKTWTTLMDIDARPEEVDLEGMNGQVLLRNSQIRWSPEFGKNYQLKLALEDPRTDVLNGESQRGNFDLVASLNKMPLGPLGRWNYRVGFVLRDLKANGFPMDPGDVLGTQSADSTSGWGITTGGRQPVTWWGDGGDFILWQLTYGKGIGHYINDLQTIGGGDAVFDPTGKLHALPVFAGYVSYQHIWPMTWKPIKAWPGILRSNFNLGWVDIGTFDFQDGSDYSGTIRASANLMYNPTDHVTMGVEFLWGERKNHDGSKGTATQLQFAARYTF
jgi:type II secretory pathway pseudopilin PulG